VKFRKELHYLVPTPRQYLEQLAHMRSLQFVSFLLFTFSISTSLAFQHVLNTKNRSLQGPFYFTSISMAREANGDNNELFDGSDEIRQKLESLIERDEIKDQQQKSMVFKPSFYSPFGQNFPSSEMEVLLPQPPPLTSIERERRQAEISLLASLEKGDHAIEKLWNHWYHERGNEAAKRLSKADLLTTQGRDKWQAAEALLKEIISKYGVHWAEPPNRLATLYFMQGRLKESEELCKTVLAVKPWHFGALSGLVMVYAGLNDVEEARRWATRRLPPYQPVGPNRRRVEWVSCAIQNAENALLDAEKRLREDFGSMDFGVDSWQ
jgi:tetratricopeptide (TPR) repeat protein